MRQFLAGLARYPVPLRRPFALAIGRFLAIWFVPCVKELGRTKFNVKPRFTDWRNEGTKPHTKHTATIDGKTIDADRDVSELHSWRAGCQTRAHFFVGAGLSFCLGAVCAKIAAWH